MKPAIPSRILDLMEEAAAIMPPSVRPESTFDGAEAFSLEDQVRLAVSLAEDEADRSKLQEFLSRLRGAYRSIAARSVGEAAFVKNTKFYAYLTILPVAAVGKSISLDQVFGELEGNEVLKRVDRHAVESAYKKVVARREMIWELRVAKGVLPERGEDARLEFLIRYLDHASLFGAPGPDRRSIRDSLEPVGPYQVLAKVHPAQPGKSGVLVSGKKLPAPHGRDLQVPLGGNVRISSKTGDLIALEHGCVVLTRDGLEVVPFLLRDASAGPIWVSREAGENRIEFAGSVYIHGPTCGPGRIRARDLYVEGDLTDIDLEVERDLFVRGTISGGTRSAIRAGGRVQATQASGARIDALGPVTILESARDVHIRSADAITVAAEGRGALESGELEATNRITAGTVGRADGRGVSLWVGTSGIVADRLTELERQDRRHEERLQAVLKEKEKVLGLLAGASVLDASRQEVYLGLLKQETAELDSRRAVKLELDRLRAATEPTGRARIEVLRKIYPPTQVRIGAASTTVETEESAPRFALDDVGRIEVRHGKRTTRAHKDI